MSTPVLLTFTTLVSRASAAVQGKATALIDLAVGSVTRAVLEANASLALWLQYVALTILSAIRLGTSSGEDVDTWLADFGQTRLPAVTATGIITLARYTATNGATVPVGATVRTGDLTRTYVVTADNTNPDWDPTVNSGGGGYVVPAGVASINVPVACTVAGSVGNVVASGINLLGTALPGIDTANNNVALTDGVDEESDSAFKARFPLYLASLPRATLLAIENAVLDVQQGLLCNVARNADEQGRFEPGHFVVTVDDGSGDPPDSLIAAVSSAVDAVRACCEDFSVQRPVVTECAVELYIAVSSGAKANLIVPVATAITAFVNALPVGATLPVSRLASVAYSVNPTITNVTGVTVNGSSADVVVAANGVVKANSVTVN